MTTLLPATPFFHYPFPRPFKTSIPSPDLASGNFKSISSHSLKHETTPGCVLFDGSPCDEVPLLSDWPQLLEVSIRTGNFSLGLAIHACLLKSGFSSDPFKGNNVVKLYSKFSRMDLARKVFDEMPLRNTVTWTSLIKGYVDNEDYRAMLEALVEMHKVGENFNEHTCSVILQACSSHGDLLLGVQIHGFVMKCAFDKNVYVSTPLISLYSRSGHLREAEKIYSSIASKDVRCLNFMILEYGNRGCGEKAMEVFINMLSTDFKPNDYSFTNIISTCNENLGAEEGMQLHGLAIKFGCIDEMSVGNAVIALYGKNGMLEEVETMFAAMSDRNLITWTTLISSYILNGLYHEAFDAFSEFRGLAVNYDSNLFSTILKGCSEWRNLGLGVQMHGLVTKFGFLYDTAIVAVLVELYAKCGKLQTARIMASSNLTTASFNGFLIGLMDKGVADDEDLLVLFSQFRSVGNNPDCVSFSRLFSISATQTSLASGKALHAYAIKAGYEKDVYVSNSMITMYAKCGSLEDAHQIFSAINDHDIVSWNALVSAYGLHGKGQSALLLFGQMKEMGIAPDEITLLATLQACSYSGLWKDGIHLFNLMEAEYGIQPLVEHYSCMVDLLGRAGYLSEAIDLINKSHFSNSPLLWRTLVNVCKLRGDMNFGKLASKKLLDLSPDEAESYILVSNMYAERGMLSEAARVRTIMNDLNLYKEAGTSWIEIDNKCHHFVASARDHPQIKEIYCGLDILTNEMRQKFNGIADISSVWCLYNQT
ncbi:Pentatricopeptide repeat-containing protein At3g09040, mitochondrial [Linum perenne]